MGARNAHLCPPVRATAGTATVCCRLEGRGRQDNDLMRLTWKKNRLYDLKIPHDGSINLPEKPAHTHDGYQIFMALIYVSPPLKKL